MLQVPLQLPPRRLRSPLATIIEPPANFDVDRSASHPQRPTLEPRRGMPSKPLIDLTAPSTFKTAVMPVEQYPFEAQRPFSGFKRAVHDRRAQKTRVVTDVGEWFARQVPSVKRREMEQRYDQEAGATAGRAAKIVDFDELQANHRRRLSE